MSEVYVVFHRYLVDAEINEDPSERDHPFRCEIPSTTTDRNGGRISKGRADTKDH